ncbi:MAG TPA: ATP-binding protein, partial [Candidatus Thermoplasmatota archaeon]|nr:ATP-binding protein [Candidatus Thermoplasmatota archaeon]
ALVSVQDEGCGLSPDVEARMFDPFFTTKADGTGLGLSITRRIVEAHGGEIRHETIVGRGTTFHVLLPACPPAAEPPRESPAAAR